MRRLAPDLGLKAGAPCGEGKPFGGWHDGAGNLRVPPDRNVLESRHSFEDATLRDNGKRPQSKRERVYKKNGQKVSDKKERE